MTRRFRSFLWNTWLSATLALSTSAGCNPGQCLRQSDCPLGAKCREGMCRTPAKPKASATGDSGAPPSPSAAPADSAVEQSAPGAPSASTAADTGTAADIGTAPDAAPAAVSEQSSNVDSPTDTAATLTP